MHATTRRLLAVLAVAALAFAGCSTSGDDDADETPTTEARQTPTTDGGDTPTTEDGGDTPTTDDGGDEPTDGPSSEELEAILHTTEDVGEDWTEDASTDDDDDSSDDSLEEQCPDLAALTSENDDDGDEVTRSFSNAEDSQLEVTLTPTARQLDADDVTEYVQAINDCGEVTLDDPDTGLTTTITFDAAADDTYSDVGLRIQGDVTLSGADLPQDISLTIYSLLWRDGPIGVEINIQDGIDEATFEAVPADTDLALAVADELAPKVSDLVG